MFYVLFLNSVKTQSGGLGFVVMRVVKQRVSKTRWLRGLAATSNLRRRSRLTYQIVRDTPKIHFAHTLPPSSWSTDGRASWWQGTATYGELVL